MMEKLDEGYNRMADDRGKDLERLTKRMDLLDQRLDNIDTMVTAVAERIMSQPISILVTCPHCKKNIEITMIGTGKLTK
jgi:hypothetical protein